MPKMFKRAATITIKPAGVKDYTARLAIAKWLREEADFLVSDHNHPLGGRVQHYNYEAERGVVGGETA